MRKEESNAEMSSSNIERVYQLGHRVHRLGLKRKTFRSRMFAKIIFAIESFDKTLLMEKYLLGTLQYTVYKKKPRVPVGVPGAAKSAAGR